MSKIDLYDNDFEKFVFTKVIPLFLLILFFLIIVLILLVISKVSLCL